MCGELCDLIVNVVTFSKRISRSIQLKWQSVRFSRFGNSSLAVWMSLVGIKGRRFSSMLRICGILVKWHWSTVLGSVLIFLRYNYSFPIQSMTLNYTLWLIPSKIRSATLAAIRKLISTLKLQNQNTGLFIRSIHGLWFQSQRHFQWPFRHLWPVLSVCLRR